MICPKCYSNSESEFKCEACGNDLSHLKTARMLADYFYQNALLAWKHGNNEEGYSFCKLSINIYPFETEHLKNIIVFLLTTGEFELSLFAIDILQKIDDHQAKKYYRMFIDTVSEYKAIILLHENGDHDAIKKILAGYDDRPPKYLRTFIKEPVQTETQYPWFFNSSIVFRRLSYIIILLMIIIPWAILIRNDKGNESLHENRLGPSLETESAAATDTRDFESIATSYKNLSIALQNKNYYDVVNEIELLDQVDPTFQKDDFNLFNAAKYFYIKGRQAYLSKNYSAAIDYYSSSLLLTDDAYFVDDAAYYRCLCFKLTNHTQSEEDCRSFLIKYPESIYAEHIKRLLNVEE